MEVFGTLCKFSGGFRRSEIRENRGFLGLFGGFPDPPESGGIWWNLGVSGISDLVEFGGFWGGPRTIGVLRFWVFPFYATAITPSKLDILEGVLKGGFFGDPKKGCFGGAQMGGVKTPNLGNSENGQLQLHLEQ